LIGAGFSGLAVAAELKNQGVAFDCLEKDVQIGGNWHQAVYEGVHIISSKHTTQFGNFPMPEWYPLFPSAQQIMDYLHSYAKHFRLFENIQFNTEVCVCHEFVTFAAPPCCSANQSPCVVVVVW
jgi:cation diffusion facilitator CzcD-associated flavoprotein CzcO